MIGERIDYSSIYDPIDDKRDKNMELMYLNCYICGFIDENKPDINIATK